MFIRLLLRKCERQELGQAAWDQPDFDNETNGNKQAWKPELDY